MKQFGCFIITILFALTGFAQLDYRLKHIDFVKFTPEIAPDAKIEKISILDNYAAVYAMINNNGTRSIIMYATDPVYEWHTIPLPDDKLQLIDISAAGDIGELYALQRNTSGQTTVSRYYNGKWSKISTDKITGEITNIVASSWGVIVGGNFVQDGHPYRVATYSDKKWEHLPVANDALFDNTTVQKLRSSGFVLLRNNSTGKYIVAEYDSDTKAWQTTEIAPGPVTDMAFARSGNLYVCGTEEGSGKPYLQRRVKGVWEKVSIDGADFSKPEIIHSADLSNIDVFIAGPAKNGSFYAFDALSNDKKWEPSAALPANLKAIGPNNIQLNNYAVAEENGKSIFYRSEYEAKKFPSVSLTLLGPPSGTLQDMARAARKRRAQQDYDKAMAENRKVYTSVVEVYKAYKEALPKYSAMRPMTNSGSGNINSFNEVDQIIDQCNEINTTFLSFYQGKLHEVKPKEDEKALSVALDNYFTAMITRIRGIGDFFRSVKNTANTVTREGKSFTGSSIVTTGFVKKLNEDSNAVNASINEFNEQLKLYNESTKLSSAIQALEDVFKQAAGQ